MPPTARARPPEHSRTRILIAFAACLLALNTLYQAPALASGDGVLALLLPSADALLLAVLACGYAWLRLPGLRSFTFVLAGIALLLLAFRTADSLVPYYFDRSFRPALDLGYLPDLYALLRDTMSPAHFYGGLLLMAATAAGLAVGLKCLFGVLGRSFRLAACRWALAALAALLVTADLLTPLAFIRDSVPARLVREIGKTGEEAPGGDTAGGEDVPEIAFRQEAVAAEGGLLSLLEGRNVLLLVVESYGYTLFSEPEHFAFIREPLARFEVELTGDGFSICSAFLESTAFGGNSWLADATLTTGVRVADEAAYRKLLASEVRPMAAYFREAGYRAVAAMPATTSAWPEGEFFAFDRIYTYPDFGYRGPNLKWAPMTDQYVLNFIRRVEIDPADSPLFVEYLLISSHYPFNLIPRYYADWSVLGDGSIYHDPEAVRVLPIKAGRQTAGAAGLGEAIAYELQLISGYLRHFVHDESLVVIVGDHQPFSGITGRGKLRSTAIHIVSRRQELLAPFLRRGYVPGALPGQPPPHPGMETFLPALLEDFSAPSAGAPAGTEPAGG